MTTVRPLYRLIAGKQHGPYSAETLRPLVKDGRISRLDRFSYDGVDWQCADQFPELVGPDRQPVKSVATPSATVATTSDGVVVPAIPDALFSDDGFSFATLLPSDPVAQRSISQDSEKILKRWMIGAGILALVVVTFVLLMPQIKYKPRKPPHAAADKPAKLASTEQEAEPKSVIDSTSKTVIDSTSKTVTNSIGMELIEIPAGTFTMGSPAGEKDREANEAQVTVTLTKPFWLGKTEVTQGQWQQVMGTAPWEGKDNVQIDNNGAATYVDWNDATAFCQELTDLERKAGKLKAGELYRLPTEAEWEYACRAGTTTAFSFGDDEKQLGQYAWFDGNAFEAGEAYPHAVGLKKPNPWGLYDMHGNVMEWCSDWHDTFALPQLEHSGNVLPGGADPAGPERGNSRVDRGGSWGQWPGDCRSASRSSHHPSGDYFYQSASSLGFRVARSQSAQ